MAKIEVSSSEMSVQCAVRAPNITDQHTCVVGPLQTPLPLYDPIQELGFWYLHRDSANRLFGYADSTNPQTLEYYGDKPHDFEPAGFVGQGPLNGIKVIRKIFAGQQPFQHSASRNTEANVEHSSYRFQWRYTGLRSSGYNPESQDQYFGILYDQYRPGDGASGRRSFDSLTLWSPGGSYGPDLEDILSSWDGHGEIRNFYWGGQSISVDDIQAKFLPNGVKLEYQVTNIVWHTHSYTAGAYIRRRCEWSVVIPEPTKAHSLDYEANTVRPLVKFVSTIIDQQATGQYRPSYPMVFSAETDGIINILNDTIEDTSSTPYPFDDNQLSVSTGDGAKFFGRGDALEVFYRRCRSDILGLISSGGYIASTSVISSYLDVLSDNLETVIELKGILGVFPVQQGVALLRAVRDKRLRQVPGTLADFLASSQLSYSWALKPLADTSVDVINNIDTLSNSIVDQFDLKPGYGTWTSSRTDWHDYDYAKVVVRAKVTPVQKDITAFMGMILQFNAYGLLPTTSNLWAPLPYSFCADAIFGLSDKFGMIDSSLLGGLALDIRHIVVSATIETPIAKPDDCYGTDGTLRYYARVVYPVIPFPYDSDWLPAPSLPKTGWDNWGAFAYLKLK